MSLLIPEVFVQPQAAAPELSLSLHAEFNDKTKHSLSDLIVKRCGINKGLFVSSAMPQGNMDVSYDETYSLVPIRRHVPITSHASRH